MTKLVIVYRNGTGNIEVMANLVADGAREAETDVSVYTPAEFTPELVDEFEHIAFGCPSMGVEWLEKSEFEPMLDSVKEKLSFRKAALFGPYGRGDDEWMRTWDSDPQGTGVPVIGTVIANEAPDDEVTENCKDLGKAPANA